MTALRLGTRRSALARAQAKQVADAIATSTGQPVELVFVTTEGDVSRASLASLGGTGVFASALRDALLRGEIDLAVHSLKDLPTAAHVGLDIVAIPVREDARDALVARDGLALDGLPSGARIGTGSPRRAAQLRAVRRDLEVVDIRGNVDTRLALVADRALDAVVLAQAGLARLGRTDVVTELLDPSIMMPAPGQGALAIEVRRDLRDSPHHTSLRALDDAATRAAVTAERAVLSALEAGCSAPVGALAVVDELGFHEPELTLTAVVAAIDGTSVKRLSITASLAEADVAGRQLATRLLGEDVAVS